MEIKQHPPDGEWLTKERRQTDKSPRTEFSLNWYENTTYRHLQDTMRTILRKMFRVLSSYTKKSERIQMNNLLVYLKALEKNKSKTNPKH